MVKKLLHSLPWMLLAVCQLNGQSSFDLDKERETVELMNTATALLFNLFEGSVDSLWKQDVCINNHVKQITVYARAKNTPAENNTRVLKSVINSSGLAEAVYYYSILNQKQSLATMAAITEIVSDTEFNRRYYGDISYEKEELMGLAFNGVILDDTISDMLMIGKLEQPDYIVNVQHKHDKVSRMIMYDYTSAPDSESKTQPVYELPVDTITIHHNNEGLVIRTDVKDQQSDSKGNIIQRNSYAVTSYDGLTATTYTYDDQASYRISLMHMNENHLPLLNEIFDADGNVISVKNYIYNDNGQLAGLVIDPSAASGQPGIRAQITYAQNGLIGGLNATLNDQVFVFDFHYEFW